MIKRKLLEKSFAQKLVKMIQNYLISFQFIMLQRNFSTNLKNLYWMKILIVVNSIQEIQLIDGKQIFILVIIKKFQLNPLFYYGDQRFIILSYIILIFLLIFIGFQQLLQRFKINAHLSIGSYIIISVFYLMTLPSFMNTLYLIFEQGIYPHLILFFITLFFCLIYILFNNQKCLLQMQGTYSNSNQEFFVLLFRLLMCVIKIKCPIQSLQFAILLFKSIVMLLLFSTITDQSSEFQFEVQIIMCSFSIAGLSQFGWPETVLLYTFFRYLILAIYERTQSNFLCQKKTVYQIQEIIQKIIYYNSKDEPFKSQMASNIFYTYKNNYQKYLNQINILIKIRIQQYFQESHFNLFFILLQYLQNKRKELKNTIFVQSYMLILKQQYLQQNQIKHSKVFKLIKILESEKINYQILTEMQEVRKNFLQIILKNTQDQNYAIRIVQSLYEYCSKLQKLKEKFESNLIQKSVSFQDFQKIDFKTIIVLQLFYCIFYQDYKKAYELGRSAKQKICQDNHLNLKLQNNTILLFKVSQFLRKGEILNKESKNLNDFFKEELSIMFLDFIPQHQQQKYSDQFINYIEGDETANQMDLYFLKQNFTYQCHIKLICEYNLDDLILNHLIIIKENSDFLLFDMTGKIIGMAEQLFYFLNENQVIKDDEVITVTIQEFLNQAMIQYYIPDISEYVKQVLLQSKNQICEFTSTFFLDLNHDDCLSHKVNFSDCNKNELSNNNTEPKILDMNFHQQFDQYNNSQNQKKKIEGKFQLEYQKSQQNADGYFYLKFRKAQKMLLEDHLVQDDFIQYDNFIIEEIINNQIMSRNLRIQLFLIGCFTLYTFLTIILNNNTEQNEIVSFQNSINFLINPQALTFSYAGSYLLQWNRYCVESGLYNLTPYIEFQRQQKLNYAFTLWKNIHVNYTINLSRRGEILNIPNVQVDSYDKFNNHTQQIMPLYDFYTITREKMVRIQKNTNFTNQSTHDYSIFLGNGFLRQNILKIFKFHDIVIQDEFDSLNERIQYSQTQFLIIEIIQIIGSLTFIISLAISIQYQIRLFHQLVKLLQLVDINFFRLQMNQIQTIEQSNSNTIQNITNFFGQETLRYENQEKQKIINKNSKFTFQNIRLVSRLRIFFPLILILFYVSEIIGATLIRDNQYYKYKSSLLMTMNYIKFKKLFDSSILLGELIKTEHLIPSNPSFLINQSETISSYLIYVDNSTNLFNKILDDLIVSNYFNQTMKDLIISAFGEDLCVNFKKFLVFCNKTQIKLPYKETDSYLSITQDGVAGVIRNYYKMVQQEYSYERQTLQYSQNFTNIKQFINSQIHQNYFVQYAQDIQSCLFTCFSYFINESIYLSQKFIEIMNEYFSITGIMLLLILLIINIFWIYSQYTELHQLKYILTIIGPELSKKKSVNSILQRIKNQI